MIKKLCLGLDIWGTKAVEIIIPKITTYTIPDVLVGFQHPIRESDILSFQNRPTKELKPYFRTYLQLRVKPNYVFSHT